MKYVIKAVKGFKKHKEWFRFCMPGLPSITNWQQKLEHCEEQESEGEDKRGITKEVCALDLKAGNSCMLPSLIRYRRTEGINREEVFKALNF